MVGGAVGEVRNGTEERAQPAGTLEETTDTWRARELEIRYGITEFLMNVCRRRREGFRGERTRGSHLERLAPETLRHGLIVRIVTQDPKGYCAFGSDDNNDKA